MMVAALVLGGDEGGVVSIFRTVVENVLVTSYGVEVLDSIVSDIVYLFSDSDF